MPVDDLITTLDPRRDWDRHPLLQVLFNHQNVEIPDLEVRGLNIQNTLGDQVPPDITFYDAAAQPETLEFTLWGAAIILPVVLGCTIYSYAVFRGKVSREGYYH